MRVCPGCGATEDEKKFVGQFCIDCFLKDHPDIVKFKKMEIPVCVHCGRMKISGKWVEPSERILSSFILSHLKTDMNSVSLDIKELDVLPSRISVVVRVCGYIDGDELCLEKELNIPIKKTQCPVCSRIHGEYWEAKIQIRGPKGEQEQALLDIESLAGSISKRDTRARMFRIEHRKEGIDVYLGSKKIARDLVKRLRNKFHAEVKRTRKLTGEDVHRGKRIYKETFSVRLGSAKGKRSKNER